MNQRSDATFPQQAVNRDGAAGVRFAIAFRVGQRSDARVEVPAVVAERQTRVERLVRVQRSARIGEIAKCAGLGVQNENDWSYCDSKVP